MKIEMNKKYKTRNGCNVTIERIAFDRAYGVIECAYKDGLFTVWWADGGILINSEMKLLGVGSGDLVEVKEVKEDYEILIEHFKNKGEPIFLVVDGEVCLCSDMEQCERSQDYCRALLVMKDDGYYHDIKKEKIKLATLEDCKKYILEK